MSKLTCCLLGIYKAHCCFGTSAGLVYVLSTAAVDGAARFFVFVLQVVAIRLLVRCTVSSLHADSSISFIYSQLIQTYSWSPCSVIHVFTRPTTGLAHSRFMHSVFLYRSCVPDMLQQIGKLQARDEEISINTLFLMLPDVRIFLMSEI